MEPCLPKEKRENRGVSLIWKERDMRLSILSQAFDAKPQGVS